MGLVFNVCRPSSKAIEIDDFSDDESCGADGGADVHSKGGLCWKQWKTWSNPQSSLTEREGRIRSINRRIVFASCICSV